MRKILIAGVVTMAVSFSFTFAAALSNHPSDTLYPVHKGWFHPAAPMVAINGQGEEVGSLYWKLCGGGGAGGGWLTLGDKLSEYAKGLF